MKPEPFRAAVLIPSYNTGVRLAETVRHALEACPDVWVVIDGSTDDSARALEALEPRYPSLRCLHLPANRGKGAAVHAGTQALLEAGFTHAVAMDADGQHPADAIPILIAAARDEPSALIMGRPIFGSDVPKARLYGRRLTLFWTDLETLFCGLGDTLFGMRSYPLAPLRAVLEETAFARGYDFDPEVAVRLCWRGHRPRQVAVPVRYFTAEEGGVSHFNYLRDNLKLTWLHLRLVPEFVFCRWPAMLRWKRQWRMLGA